MDSKLSIADRVALGLAAGLAGTIVMTLGQKAEMALTRRPPSKTPAKAVETVSGVELARVSDELRASNLVHVGYGTALGAVLAAGDRLPAPSRTAAFFALAWAGGSAMLTLLRLAKPPQEQATQDLLTDIGHHAVYAATAGTTYALLRRAMVERRA